MKKRKIGIVSEHHIHDGKALQHLLEQVICEGVQFMPIAKNFYGSDLDSTSKSFVKALQSEWLSKGLEKIIFVRDADTVISEQILLKKHKCDKWFQQLNDSIDENGVFFLAIAEMEALILSDITNFNKLYQLKIKSVGNPMKILDPKALLKKYSSKSTRGSYEENHAPDIFKKLEFKTVYQNHQGERSFQAFADVLKTHKIIDFKIDE